MLSLFSASMSQASNAADVRDSVTTHEANVVIEGQSYRQVRFEGHDYFLREARPGSVLVEVRCQRPIAETGRGQTGATEAATPTPMPATAMRPSRDERARSSPSVESTALAVASRSRAFVDKLQDGCAPKEGLPPERFTFEQRENRAAKSGQGAVKPKRKVELLGPNSFPSDLDPHVLPEPLPAGGNFDRNQKRY